MFHIQTLGFRLLTFDFFNFLFEVTAVVVCIFARFVGFQTADHVVEVHQMAVKFWSVHANEFGFRTDGYAATAAHAGSVYHDGVE